MLSLIILIHLVLDCVFVAVILPLLLPNYFNIVMEEFQLWNSGVYYVMYIFLFVSLVYSPAIKYEWGALHASYAGAALGAAMSSAYFLGAKIVLGKLPMYYGIISVAIAAMNGVVLGSAVVWLNS